MLSIKLFRLVFCLFGFNRNIENICFGIEPKQPEQTVSKQTKHSEATLNLVKKKPKYALYHTVSVALLFVRSKTETNILFRIVPN
jgi:hypothetical protein